MIFSHNYDLHSAEQQFAERRLVRGKVGLAAEVCPFRETPLLPHSLTPEFLPAAPLYWVPGPK